jgi:hypothetical protein
MNKINTWFSENKPPAVLSAVFLSFCGVAGWYAFSSWDDYSVAMQSFTEAKSKLNLMAGKTPPPTDKNLALLEKSKDADQDGLNSLLSFLKQYKIPAFHDIEKAKPQDEPQFFQDALRAQVTKLKTAAGTAGATLPSGFYLALEDYENRLPSPEDTVELAKQLTVFNWVCEQLISHPGLIVAEFSKTASAPTTPSARNDRKPQPTAAIKPAPYWNPANLKVSFRCNQGSLRDIINSFSKAPYFLVIDNLQLQNTITEPPHRDNSQHQPVKASVNPSGDGQTIPVQRIPIVVGREEINVSLRIRVLDFAERQEKTTPAQ